MTNIHVRDRTPYLVSVMCGLLAKVVQTLPIGTAYPLWIGIGAVGTVLLGIVCFNERTSFARIFFIVTMIASVVGSITV